MLAGVLVLAVASLAALGGYLAMRASLFHRAARTAEGQARQLAALVDVPSPNGAEEPTGSTEGQPAQAGNQGNRVDITDPTLTHELAMAGTLIEVDRPNGALILRANRATSGHAKRGVVEITRRPMLEPRHDRFEHATIETHGMATRPQR